jgi:hypothetical protein
MWAAEMEFCVRSESLHRIGRLCNEGTLIVFGTGDSAYCVM